MILNLGQLTRASENILRIYCRASKILKEYEQF